LVKVLPVIGKFSCFALKGGTAINLFHRNMPRLSVDIDLVYLPINGRDESLQEITDELNNIAKRINQLFPLSKIQFSKLDRTDYLSRLIVENERAIIKIELSPVLRGTVHKPEIKTICRRAEEDFGFAEVPVVSFEDLYAGKLMAALDRQHPRDLFDVTQLIENEGISPSLKETFLVYLISHNRRFLEILNPSLLDMNNLFETDFRGMTTEPVEICVLEKTRTDLISLINQSLTKADKQFLVDFKEGKPDWSFFSVDHIQDLPAVKWKIYNLSKMNDSERNTAIDKLKDYFEI
jgi:predicted nucleotidyltransferase component of viral defense system